MQNILELSLQCALIGNSKNQHNFLSHAELIFVHRYLFNDKPIALILLFNLMKSLGIFNTCTLRYDDIGNRAC